MEHSQEKQHKTEPLSEDKKEKKAKLGFYLVLGFIVGLIVLFLIFSIFIGNFQVWFAKKPVQLTYQGLSFTLEAMNGLTIYHLNYPLLHPSGKVFYNNLLLRNDPSKNNVSVEGRLTFEGDNDLYVSVDSNNLRVCPNILRDVSFIPYFMVNNFFNVSTGNTNATVSQTDNLTYYSCENNPDKNVIAILPSFNNVTRIVHTGKCYKIYVANCDLLNASEKFEVQAIIDNQEKLLTIGRFTPN